MQFEQFPYPLRQAAVTMIGWRNRYRRFGGEYRRWAKLLQESAGWGFAQRQTWQQAHLADLARSARSGTTYYSKVLPDPALLTAASSLRDALQLVPLLEKDSLRMQPQAFRNINVKEVIATSTSGSTGSPMQVGHDAPSIQRRFSFLVDHLRLAGVDPRAPSIRLSGRLLCEAGKKQRRPWLFNRAENQLFLSSYHLDADHMKVIARRLDQLQPVLFDGYPSGILETLRLMRAAGQKMPSLRAIITTAETLLPDVRAELRELSGVPVMDYYAASEGVPLIQQCRYGTYHVRWQSGIFEVDHGDGIGFEGDGELICTSFVQDRTPLIRYRTGDLVHGLRQNSPNPCACGLNTPVVEQILGRLEDLVHTRDGGALGMFTYRTLKLIAGLGETQVVQHDHSIFEVNTVAQEGCDMQRLTDEVKISFERVLGYSVTLRLNRVSRLPKGANGKVRLVISNVARSPTESPQ